MNVVKRITNIVDIVYIYFFIDTFFEDIQYKFEIICKSDNPVAEKSSTIFGGNQL